MLNKKILVLEKNGDIKLKGEIIEGFGNIILNSEGNLEAVEFVESDEFFIEKEHIIKISGEFREKKI